MLLGVFYKMEQRIQGEHFIFCPKEHVGIGIINKNLFYLWKNNGFYKFNLILKHSSLWILLGITDILKSQFSMNFLSIKNKCLLRANFNVSLKDKQNYSYRCCDFWLLKSSRNQIYVWSCIWELAIDASRSIGWLSVLRGFTF